MNKTLKYIIIGIVVLAVVGVIVFFLIDGKSLGAFIALLTGGWAIIKAKLFSSGKTEQEIIQQHETTRQSWDTIKQEYDSSINALKARMDYLDYRSAKISAQINDLKTEEKAKIEQFNQMNDQQKEDFINNLLKQP